MVHGFDGFKTFVQEPDYQLQLSGSHDCLLDFVDAWIWSGPGTDHCFGDFQIYLITIAIIIDEWHKTPDLLDFRGDPKIGQPDEVIERRVSSVFKGVNRQHSALDPYNFAAAAYNWQHNERS